MTEEEAVLLLDSTIAFVVGVASVIAGMILASKHHYVATCVLYGVGFAAWQRMAQIEKRLKR